MSKLRPLKPSLTEKIRYLSFEVITEHKMDFKEAEKLIKASTQQFLGSLELAKAGIMIVKNKYSNNKGIIRVNRKYVDHLKASLALISKESAIFRSLKVSGMINKAFKSG